MNVEVFCFDAVAPVRERGLKYKLFKDYYWIAADVGEIYRPGYANRAQTTYEYVAGIDLTTPYGVPAYGEAGNGR